MEDKEVGNVVGFWKDQWVSLKPSKRCLRFTEPSSYPEETILVEEKVQIGNGTGTRERFAGLEARDFIREDLSLCYADEIACCGLS